VEDVDKVYARALDEGATSLAAPRDLPYGDRSAGVQDAQGNYWWIGTRLSGAAATDSNTSLRGRADSPSAN
jgi:uncharacterized glyoxalase superfamily protein PhnB